MDADSKPQSTGLSDREAMDLQNRRMAWIRRIDVQMLLGHSDLTMTHRYARTYTSEQAVRAHPGLSPVNRLVG